MLPTSPRSLIQRARSRQADGNALARGLAYIDREPLEVVRIPRRARKRARSRREERESWGLLDRFFVVFFAPFFQPGGLGIKIIKEIYGGLRAINCVDGPVRKSLVHER